MKKVILFVMVLVVGLVLGLGSAQVPGTPPPPDKLPPFESPIPTFPDETKDSQCLEVFKRIREIDEMYPIVAMLLRYDIAHGNKSDAEQMKIAINQLNGQRALELAKWKKNC